MKHIGNTMLYRTLALFCYYDHYNDTLNRQTYRPIIMCACVVDKTNVVVIEKTHFCCVVYFAYIFRLYCSSAYYYSYYYHHKNNNNNSEISSREHIHSGVV